MRLYINSNFARDIHGYRIEASWLRPCTFHASLRKNPTRESFGKLAARRVGNTHEKQVHATSLCAGKRPEQGRRLSEIHNELNQKIMTDPVRRRLQFVGELVHVAEFEP